MTVSYWRRIVALCSLGLLVIAAVSSSQSWSKNYRGAKKEGQLVYYTTMTLDQSRVTVDHFEKKYPFLKVTLFRTGGGPLLNKIICRVARRQT